MLAFGVGAGATGATNGLNLRAISGTTSYNGSNGAAADFYQTADYDAVGTALRNLALGNCQGTLTVTKQIVPSSAPAGSITGAAPAGAGWQFTSVMNTAGCHDSERRAHDDRGRHGNRELPDDLPGGTTCGSVTVTEAQQPGFILQPVNGRTPSARTSTPAHPSRSRVTRAIGFTVTVPSTETVNCTSTTEPPEPRPTSPSRRSGSSTASAFENGAQPSDLSVAAAADRTRRTWRDRPGLGRDPHRVLAGRSTTLSETVILDRSDHVHEHRGRHQRQRCRHEHRARSRVPDGAAEGAQHRDDHQHGDVREPLTLIKQVQGGSAAPTAGRCTLVPRRRAGPQRAAGFSGKTGTAAMTWQP